jgi:hypothetical protein
MVEEFGFCVPVCYCMAENLDSARGFARGGGCVVSDTKHARVVLVFVTHHNRNNRFQTEHEDMESLLVLFEIGCCSFPSPLPPSLKYTPSPPSLKHALLFTTDVLHVQLRRACGSPRRGRRCVSFHRDFSLAGKGKSS